LSKKISLLNVDIVHLALQNGFTSDHPYIYHPHDLQHLHHPEYFDEATIRHRETIWKAFAENSSKIICASEFVRKDLMENWSIDNDKLKVLPMPTPIPSLSFSSDLGTKRHSIIYVANFWLHKNQETLIRAVRKLSESIPDVQLTLIGEGATRARCEEISGELGLNDSVRFLGSVNQSRLESELSMHEIVCVPSEFEAASFPIIDAMRFNKKVVASSISPFREMAGFGINLYGEPKDYLALARELEKEFATFPVSESVAKSYQNYLATIAPNRIGEKLVSIYEEAMGVQS
jgi:glycosyltransferase involved in cell wall biosynthesis